MSVILRGAESFKLIIESFAASVRWRSKGPIPRLKDAPGNIFVLPGRGNGLSGCFFSGPEAGPVTLPEL